MAKHWLHLRHWPILNFNWIYTFIRLIWISGNCFWTGLAFTCFTAAVFWWRFFRITIVFLNSLLYILLLLFIVVYLLKFRIKLLHYFCSKQILSVSFNNIHSVSPSHVFVVHSLFLFLPLYFFPLYHQVLNCFILLFNWNGKELTFVSIDASSITPWFCDTKFLWHVLVSIFYTCNSALSCVRHNCYKNKFKINQNLKFN